MSKPFGARRCVYVVAGTIDGARHAIGVAQTLAVGDRSELVVIVSPPRRMPVSSGRPNIDYSLGDSLERATIQSVRALVQGVRELVGRLAPRAEVVVTPSSTAWGLSRLLPAGATLVMCGPIHRFLEAPEHRLARELTKQGYDVVFLPRQDEPAAPSAHTPRESVMAAN